MSDLKPLTSRQKEIVATYYLKFDEWGVERESVDYLYLRNRLTGKKKAVAKRRVKVKQNARTV